MPAKREKERFLEASGALNPEPERVEDEKFRSPGGFFDPRDKVQVKYEMLRAHGVDRESVAAVARRFGYSRETFYDNLERLAQEGILGLGDHRRGRKGPDKLTEEVMSFILECKRGDPEVSGSHLCERVAERFGLDLHKRTIEKAVARAAGVQKKTRPRGPKEKPLGRRRSSS